MLEIRKARPEDAAAILAYMNQIGGESDNLLFGAGEITVSAEQEAAFIQAINGTAGSVMLVGIMEEAIVSIVTLQRYSRSRVAHRANLAISVRKDHWNQGIGTKMMQALIDFAKAAGLTVLELEVRTDNDAAIRLYEKMGFHTFGAYPRFVQINGVYYDANYMTLQLE